MDPAPEQVLEKATAVAVSNPEQAMIMLQTLGKFLKVWLPGQERIFKLSLRSRAVRPSESTVLKMKLVYLNK